MNDILILNARTINEDDIREQDIYIRNGRIKALGKDLSSRKAGLLIDAAGKWVLPGLIDDQVHFREPGGTHKGSISSESRAAVAGGVTSFMEMPNTQPPTVTRERLEEKYVLAARTSAANFAFYLGATNDNIGEVSALLPGSAAGVKVFMGASTGNMLVDDPRTLRDIFRTAPTLVATHCEDTPTIKRREAEFRTRYGEDVPPACHPEIRSREACLKSSELAVALAREHDARLHILHISTAEELALFTRGPLRDKRITAEACVHHLYFDRRDYETQGMLIKCNPAIKESGDRKALIQALAEDRIDVIATDHAPHTREEKTGSYFTAPSGIPLVQHSLLMLLDLFRRGEITLERLVRKSSHAVADLFDIRERGYIREDYWADLVIVDPDRPYRVSRDNIHYHCGWSPLEGREFFATIDTTIVSGQVVFRDGHFFSGVRGKAIGI